jgi:predicted porin
VIAGNGDLCKPTTGDVFMQKKLLALAVAGALAPAAAMAQSTVEIYGRANLSIDQWKATGSTSGTADFASRMRIVDSGSRLGFRVNEGLGGGMRAFVVMESGVNVDNGSTTGQSGAANTSTGTWASRDSYLGIGGGWGDVRWGRQSIFWSNGVIAQTGANYINSAADGLTTGGFGMVKIPVARQSNVISYNSPTMGGFNASLSYSPNNTEGSAYTGTAQKKDAIWGITGRYTGGALRAQFDWAKRDNTSSTAAVGGTDNFATPATGTPEIKAWKLGLGWAYAPGSQISWVYERLENNKIQFAIGNSAVAGDSPKVTINLINWEHMLGQWQLLAQYAFSSEVKGISGADTSNTKVKGFTLAAKYFLSKRTGAYVSYSSVTNQANAFGDLSGGGFSSAGAAGLSATNEGADPRIMAVGVMHNF